MDRFYVSYNKAQYVYLSDNLGFVIVFEWGS